MLLLQGELRYTLKTKPNPELKEPSPEWEEGFIFRASSAQRFLRTNRSMVCP